MQRYFFHIDYGEPQPDAEGTLYPSLKAAREAAVLLFGEVLRDQGDAFWEKPNITLTVTDERGLVLWGLETVGSASAAVSGATGATRP